MTAIATKYLEGVGDDWNCKTLGDVCRPVGGGTPSRSQPNYWNGNIPWASVKDFSDDSLVLSKTQEHITQEGLESSASTLIPSDTPVICTRMAVGRCAVTTRPTAINQDLKALPLNGDFELDYFIRLLRFHAPDLDRVSIGSTVRGITTKDLLKLPLRFPQKPHQARIAAVLDQADKAVAKTETVIAKLRQVRTGLIYDLLTCGLDENGYIRDPIAHPEQFKDSLLGRIPNEWAIRRLDELALVDRGKFGHRPRNEPRFYNGLHWFIQTGDVSKAEGDVITNSSQTLNEEGASISKQFPAGTIVITIAANIADTAILGCPMFLTDSVVGAVIKSPNNCRYIELCIRRAKSQLEARAPQTAQMNINLQDLRPLPIPIPSNPNEQHEIARIYESQSEMLLSEEAFLAKLRKLKSGLIDDLLTGRVHVA